MIPSGHTTPPPLPLTIQLAFPQKCLFTLLVADIRLVLRLSCRLFRWFPFLPSEVQLLPPPDRLSPQILSAVLCSSNFVVSPDVFGQEDVSVSPAPGNSLPQKKKKTKHTHIRDHFREILPCAIVSYVHEVEWALWRCSFLLSLCHVAMLPLNCYYAIIFS